jgi:hypothetical protein
MSTTKTTRPNLELKPDFGGADDVRGCAFTQKGDKLTANCGGSPNIFGDVKGQAESP